jgi:hypothetical protein
MRSSEGTMRQTRKLPMEANLVAEERTNEVSERAQREPADPSGTSALAGPGENRLPRRGRRVRALAAAVVILAGLGVGVAVLRNQVGSPPGSSDEPYFASTEALEARADAIVRGTITQAAEEESNGYPETIATVAVRSVAKGSPVPRQSLQISYTTPGSGPESASLKVRGEYVFLLELGPDGMAYLVSSTQGWFRVDGAKVVAAPDNDIDLSPAVRGLLGLGQ